MEKIKNFIVNNRVKVIIVIAIIIIISVAICVTKAVNNDHDDPVAYETTGAVETTDKVTEPETTVPETEPETEPETTVSDTTVAETTTPETETKAPETVAPDTQAPVVDTLPETAPPASQVPETAPLVVEPVETLVSGNMTKDEIKEVQQHLASCRNCGNPKDEHHHRFMSDTNCPECGVLVVALECHYCNNDD